MSGGPIENLVLWLKMDEGTGTTAFDSAGSNDGSLVNSPTWVSGPSGGADYAVEFDGIDDYIDCGYFSPSNAITFTAWINPDYLGGVDGHQISGTAAYNGWQSTNFFILGNRIFAQLAEQFVGDRYWESDPITIPLGSWSHVAYTQSSISSIPTFYLNGVSVGGSLNYSNGSQPSRLSELFAVGRRGAESNRYFSGIIDDVRVYDIDLSAAQILSIYNEV